MAARTHGNPYDYPVVATAPPGYALATSPAQTHAAEALRALKVMEERHRRMKRQRQEERQDDEEYHERWSVCHRDFPSDKF